MVSPDHLPELDQAELNRDLHLIPLWYGYICGLHDEKGEPIGRFLDGRVDFLVHTGGFVEAERLVREFPLGGEKLPQGRAIIIPTISTAHRLDELFGNDERIAIRVVNARYVLSGNASTLMVVAPCNSKRWLERAKSL
ncbi:MAG: hypothetical protein M1607_01765 [Patescibacteria group bacterium]|nr:hypothetical protein [Patescibacteria group bacterium]